jgi:hypothetical protein
VNSTVQFVVTSLGGVVAGIAAALTVLAIWAGTTVTDMISATYNPPDGINTVALAAATYLFGSAFFKENNDR